MELYMYLFGILTCLYFVLGVYFYVNRREDAPYREAFAWAMFIGGGVVSLTESGYYFFFNVPDFEDEVLLTCLDTAMSPFYVLEILCILYQDIQKFPWKRRWIIVGILELPILVFAVSTFVTTSSWVEKASFVTVSIYGFSLLVFTLYAYLKYKRSLSKIEHAKEQEIDWIWYIIVLSFSQLLAFFISESLVRHEFFLVVLLLTNLQHAYYLNRQVPVDTNKMYAEEKEKTMNELREITAVLKKQNDIDALIKAFGVQHPGFEARLRNSTETKLTKHDIYLCTLIYEGKKSQEISELLEISSNSVEVARYRLRTKLNLEKGTNLKTEITDLINA